MSLDASFTDEQLALRDVARDLFAEASGPDRLRARWAAETYDPATWKQLASVGLTGVGIDEELGGQGGSPADLVLVAEEAGAACLPDPLVETLFVAAPSVADTTWRQRIAAGDALVRVQQRGAPFVLDADVVDALIAGRRDESGYEVFLVERDGIRVGRRVPSEDGTRRLFEADIDLDGAVSLGPADPVRARIFAGTALELVGLCRQLVDMCVEHVTVRKQFDVPVGSFQAVQHALANMYVELESARGAARHAGRLVSADATDPDALHAAHVAKAAAGRAHRLINRDALQLHGGIGFTWEHDLHLWLKRGNALAASFGDDTGHRAMLAVRLLAHRPADG